MGIQNAGKMPNETFCLSASKKKHGGLVFTLRSNRQVTKAIQKFTNREVLLYYISLKNKKKLGSFLLVQVDKYSCGRLSRSVFYINCFFNKIHTKSCDIS